MMINENKIYDIEIIKAKAWMDEQERRDSIKEKAKKEKERRERNRKLIGYIIVYSFSLYMLYLIIKMLFK